MATNYTSTYKLCQWDESDQVNRLEFNQDNSRIEAGLNSLMTKITALETSISNLSTILDAAYSANNPSVTYGAYSGTGSSQYISLKIQPKVVIAFTVNKTELAGFAFSGVYSTTGGITSASTSNVSIGTKAATFSSAANMSSYQYAYLALA